MVGRPWCLSPVQGRHASSRERIVNAAPRRLATVITAGGRQRGVTQDRFLSQAPSAVAHLRRYENQYLEYWDGTDDRGQGQHSFSDYLVRMAHPSAWGGPLEIQALTRTAKCNILILPEDASMSACAFVSGDSRPSIVLWHTKDHYDLLLPTSGDTYPGVLLDLAKEQPNHKFPRAGASEASCPSSAPTAYREEWNARHAQRRGAPAPSVASSAPTAYRQAQIAGPRAPPRVGFSARELGSGRGQKDQPRSIKEFFTRSVDLEGPPKPDAPVPGSPVDSLDECMPAPVAADAQPRFDSRGRTSRSEAPLCLRADCLP